MKSTGRTAEDSGMTLVELLVYLMVTVVVLGGLASIFVSAWNADLRTRERDLATGLAQLVSSSLQSSMRNAVGAPTINAEGTVVRARVFVADSAGDGAWFCRGWAVRTDGSILYAESESAIDDPESASSSEWAVIASNDTSGLDTEPERQSFFSPGGPREVRATIVLSVGKTTVEVTSAATAQGAGRPGSGAETSCEP